MIASRLFLPVLAFTLAIGCATAESTIAPIVTPTAIVVSPADFLGDVVCSDSPGALRSYVATITDLTIPGSPFTLPSSPPVNCATPVFFRYAIVGHSYSAVVDGYDLSPDAIAPLGGTWTGARQMVLANTTTLVKPRWTTKCSDQPSTIATAIFQENIDVAGCDPLTDSSGSITGIELDFSAALGTLKCGGNRPSDTHVATVDIIPEDPALQPTVGVDCSVGKVFFADGILPGETYVFDVAGRSAKVGLVGETIVWGGRCFAKAEANVTTLASCDPITSSGDVRFDAAPLLAEANIACGPGVSFYATSSGTSTTPVACDETVRMGPLPAGKKITATLTVTGASKPLQASCTATVAAAQTVDATCMNLP